MSIKTLLDPAAEARRRKRADLEAQLRLLEEEERYTRPSDLASSHSHDYNGIASISETYGTSQPSGHASSSTHWESNANTWGGETVQTAYTSSQAAPWLQPTTEPSYASRGLESLDRSHIGNGSSPPIMMPNPFSPSFINVAVPSQVQVHEYLVVNQKQPLGLRMGWKIEGYPFSVYDLFSGVLKLGGSTALTRRDWWSNLAGLLGIPSINTPTGPRSSGEAGAQLRAFFTQKLGGLEIMWDRTRSTDGVRRDDSVVEERNLLAHLRVQVSSERDHHEEPPSRHTVPLTQPLSTPVWQNRAHDYSSHPQSSPVSALSSQPSNRQLHNAQSDFRPMLPPVQMGASSSRSNNRVHRQATHSHSSAPYVYQPKPAHQSSPELAVRLQSQAEISRAESSSGRQSAGPGSASVIFPPFPYRQEVSQEISTNEQSRVTRPAPSLVEARAPKPPKPPKAPKKQKSIPIQQPIAPTTSAQSVVAKAPASTSTFTSDSSKASGQRPYTFPTLTGYNPPKFASFDHLVATRALPLPRLPPNVVLDITGTPSEIYAKRCFELRALVKKMQAREKARNVSVDEMTFWQKLLAILKRNPNIVIPGPQPMISEHADTSNHPLLTPVTAMGVSATIETVLSAPPSSAVPTALPEPQALLAPAPAVIRRRGKGKKRKALDDASAVTIETAASDANGPSGSSSNSFVGPPSVVEQNGTGPMKIRKPYTIKLNPDGTPVSSRFAKRSSMGLGSESSVLSLNPLYQSSASLSMGPSAPASEDVSDQADLSHSGSYALSSNTLPSTFDRTPSTLLTALASLAPQAPMIASQMLPQTIDPSKIKNPKRIAGAHAAWKKRREEKASPENVWHSTPQSTTREMSVPASGSSVVNRSFRTGSVSPFVALDSSPKHLIDLTGGRSTYFRMTPTKTPLSISGRNLVKSKASSAVSQSRSPLVGVTGSSAGQGALRPTISAMVLPAPSQPSQTQPQDGLGEAALHPEVSLPRRRFTAVKKGKGVDRQTRSTVIQSAPAVVPALQETAKRPSAPQISLRSPAKAPTLQRRLRSGMLARRTRSFLSAKTARGNFPSIKSTRHVKPLPRRSSAPPVKPTANRQSNVAPSHQKKTFKSLKVVNIARSVTRARITRAKQASSAAAGAAKRRVPVVELPSPSVPVGKRNHIVVSDSEDDEPDVAVIALPMAKREPVNRMRVVILITKARRYKLRQRGHYSVFRDDDSEDEVVTKRHGHLGLHPKIALPRGSLARYARPTQPEPPIARFISRVGPALIEPYKTVLSEATLLKRVSEEKCLWKGCGAVLASEWHLTRHVAARDHAGEGRFKAGTYGEQILYRCHWTTCEGPCFATKSQLSQHMSAMHISKGLHCPYDLCDLTFGNSSLLARHVLRHHESPEDTPLPLADLSEQIAAIIPTLELPVNASSSVLITPQVAGSIYRSIYRRDWVVSKVQNGSLAPKNPDITITHPPRMLEVIDDSRSSLSLDTDVFDFAVDWDEVLRQKALDVSTGRRRTRWTPVVEVQVKKRSKEGTWHPSTTTEEHAPATETQGQSEVPEDEMDIDLPDILDQDARRSRTVDSSPEVDAYIGYGPVPDTPFPTYVPDADEDENEDEHGANPAGTEAVGPTGVHASSLEEAFGNGQSTIEEIIAAIEQDDPMDGEFIQESHNDHHVEVTHSTVDGNVPSLPHPMTDLEATSSALGPYPLHTDEQPEASASSDAAAPAVEGESLERQSHVFRPLPGSVLFAGLTPIKKDQVGFGEAANPSPSTSIRWEWGVANE